METKAKHLELCQSVIARLALNSFQIKGWAVTLVSALTALGAKEANPRFAWVVLIPTLAFWVLDAYFVRQERMFRTLYDAIRTATPPIEDWSLDAWRFSKDLPTLTQTMLSGLLLVFYGALAAAGGLVLYLLK